MIQIVGFHAQVESPKVNWAQLLQTFNYTVCHYASCLGLIVFSSHTYSTGERSDSQRQPESVRSRWWRRCRKWRGLKPSRIWTKTSRKTSSLLRPRTSPFTSKQKRPRDKYPIKTNAKLWKGRSCGWHRLDDEWMTYCCNDSVQSQERECGDSTVQSCAFRILWDFITEESRIWKSWKRS